MRIQALALAATAALLAAGPAAATKPVGVVALQVELDRRGWDGDYGARPSLGRTFLRHVDDALDRLGSVQPVGLSRAERTMLRSIPRTLRRLYPDEFLPGTPDDLSDRLDEYLPAATAYWRAEIESRLSDLEGLVAMSGACGHAGRAKEMAKLSRLVARARAALDAADAGATPEERYDRTIAADVITLTDAERRGLVPAHYEQESSLRARFGARSVSASGEIYDDPWGDESTTGVDSSFADGTLQVRAVLAHSVVQFSMQRDLHWIYELRFDVAGAAAAGPHPFASASLVETRIVADYHGPWRSHERTFTPVSGTFTVTEACDDRIVATFTLEMRSASGAKMTVRGTDLGAWLGTR